MQGGQNESSRILIATYCSQGRHRSIAAFSLLQDILQTEFDIHVCGVFQSCKKKEILFKLWFLFYVLHLMTADETCRRHFGEPFWHLGTCRFCDECRNNHKTAKGDFAYARWLAQGWMLKKIASQSWNHACTDWAAALPIKIVIQQLEPATLKIIRPKNTIFLLFNWCRMQFFQFVVSYCILKSQCWQTFIYIWLSSMLFKSMTHSKAFCIFV